MLRRPGRDGLLDARREEGERRGAAQYTGGRTQESAAGQPCRQHPFLRLRQLSGAQVGPRAGPTCWITLLGGTGAGVEAHGDHDDIVR